jgi:two-component system chemotaxis response regulator CheY
VRTLSFSAGAADNQIYSVSMTTILIVDDSPTIRRMVRTALQFLDINRFVEAGSGLEAIEQLTLTSISLMVLDLNMPDMHGLDVLKFVRQHPTYAALPIVVLTTRGDDASRTAALTAGATVYLTKPFVPQTLSDHTRALLDMSAADVRRGHVES